MKTSRRLTTWKAILIASALLAVGVGYLTWTEDIYDVVAAEEFERLQVVVTVQDNSRAGGGESRITDLEEFPDCRSIDIVNVLREQGALTGEAIDLSTSESVRRFVRENARARAKALGAIIACMPTRSLTEHFPASFGLRVRRWYEF